MWRFFWKNIKSNPVKKVAIKSVYPHVSATFKYKFLEEKPLVDKELKFGHKEIALSLENMIINCHTPFTIGLYGKWGSGKSTITENIKKNLKGKKIPVIIFDVWKHEGDALRRTFLKELVNQLKDFGGDFFDTSFKLDERVYYNISDAEEVISIFKEKLFKHLGIIALFALFLISPILLFCGLFYLTFHINLLNAKYVLPIVTTIVSFFSVDVVYKYINQFLRSKKTETKKDKYQDPHEFETEFSNILCKLETQRIVIVFDNLDRVSGENAVKIISTIKTFLEPADIKNEKKEVVFLIPCDVNAVKDHLIKIYKEKDDEDGSKVSLYSDEFLRKFFNTIVWITDFYPTELDKYALEKLKETEIESFNNEQISWLITKVFRNNPRQIIQFINILVSNYILLYEREVKKELDDNFLKNNIVALAKYLLMIQIFPDIMEKVKATKFYNISTIKKREDLGMETFESQFVAFDQFLKETTHIPIDNLLSVFFTFRKSGEEQKLPGVERFIQLLQDRQEQEAEKHANTIEIKNKIDEISSILKLELDKIKSPTIITSIVSTLFHVTNKIEISLTNTAYRDLENKLVNSALDQLHTIKPSLIASELFEKHPSITSNNKRKILEHFIKVLKDYADNKTPNIKVAEEYYHNALTVLAKYPDDIHDSDKAELKIILTKKFSKDRFVAELFISNETLQKKFIDGKFTEGLIETLANDEYEPDKPKEISTLIEKINPKIFEGNSMTVLIDKIGSLIATENGKDFESRKVVKKDLLSFCTRMLKKVKEQIHVTTENESKYQTLASIVLTDTEPFDVNQKWIFIPLVSEFEQIVHKFFTPSKEYKKSFFENLTDGKVLSELLEYAEPTLEFISLNKNILLSKAVTKGPFLPVIYDKAEEKLKYDILIGLINGKQYKRFWEHINLVGINIPEKEKVVERILTETNKNDIAFEHKIEFYKTLELLLPEKSSEYNKEYIRQIIEIIKANNENTVKGIEHLNISTYLSDIEKTEIIKSCLDIVSVAINILNSYTPLPQELFEEFYTKTKSEIVKNIVEKNDKKTLESLTTKAGIDQNILSSDLLDTIFTWSSDNRNKLIQATDVMNWLINSLSKELYEKKKDLILKLTDELLNTSLKLEIQKFAVSLLNKIKEVGRINQNLRNKIIVTYENPALNLDLIPLLKPFIIKDKEKEFKFSNQPPPEGHAGNDDHVYPEILDLMKYSYSVKINPEKKIERWRVGLKFSKTINFPEVINRVASGFPLFHVTKNEDSKEISTRYYNEKTENVGDKATTIDNYSRQTLIVKIKKFGDSVMIDVLNDKEESILKEPHTMPYYRYCQCSAWADSKNEYSIETNIIKQIE